VSSLAFSLELGLGFLCQDTQQKESVREVEVGEP